MPVHVRFESWHISLPSSARQQREMTKFWVVYGTWTTKANFSHFHLELYLFAPAEYAELPLWNVPDSKGSESGLTARWSKSSSIACQFYPWKFCNNFRLPGILTYRTDRLKMCIDGINFELWRNDLCRNDFVSNRPDTACQSSCRHAVKNLFLTARNQVIAWPTLVNLRNT